jgi:CHASE2 domain-containing sensor protein
MSIPSIEMKAANDLSLNDLFYKINHETGEKKISDKIVLINSGDLSIDTFRSELSHLINQINFYNPKVIGIDHDFSDNGIVLGTGELINSISNNSKIILGKDKEDNSKKLKIRNAKYGTVNFFEHYHTIRRYENAPTTFAAKIAEKYLGKSMGDNKKESFILNYVAQDFKELRLKSADINNFKFSNESNYKIPMFNAKDVLYSDNYELLQHLIKDKIIMIGHLGSTSLRSIRNDLEDKFPVPCDTNILFRRGSMPGVLVHANAVENMINSTVRFRVISDESWFLFIEEGFIILYLYFLLYSGAGKLINISMMLVLSLPLLFLVIYLMKHNYYVEMGATLLQLLIFEEVVEIIEPFYKRLKNKTLTLLK